MHCEKEPKIPRVFVLREEGDAGVVLLRRIDLMEKSDNPEVEVTEWYPVDQLHRFNIEPIMMAGDKLSVEDQKALEQQMAEDFKQEMVLELAKLGFNEAAVLNALAECDDNVDVAMERLMANHLEDAEEADCQPTKEFDAENTPKANQTEENGVPSPKVDSQDSGPPTQHSSDEGLQSEADQKEIEKRPDKEGDGISEDAAKSKAEASRRKNQKKRAAKKRKKLAEKKKNQKSVSFGEVAVLDIERGFGVTAVPAKGCWPLGLWEDCIGKRTMSLEDYEALRQKRLEARMAKLSKRQRKLMNGVLETRQFDFKLEIKNPLFTVVSEEDRKKILLGEEEEEVPKPKKGRSRRSSANVTQEELSEGSDEAVDGMTTLNQEVKEELQQLRISRDNTGCSCTKVKNVDKLHQNKIKELLKACGCEFDAHGSKKELANQLKAALEGKGMCELLSCECFRAGVDCHADVCGCCFIISHGKKVQVNGAKKCGNPNGLYTYKVETVERYRFRLLNKEELEA